MSTETIAVGDNDIEVVWADLQRYSQFQDANFKVNTDSTTGSIVLLTDGATPAAVKIMDANSHYDSRALQREALLMSLLYEAAEPSPVYIPRVIEVHPTPPYYLAMHTAPGRVLSRSEVMSLSAEEKRSLGERVGRFAAWMADVIDPATYEELLYETSVAVVDKVAYITQHYRQLPQVRAYGCLTLARIFDDTLDEFRYGDYSSARPTIIGHDDIRPTNISFEYDKAKGQWELASIFDFGVAKPTVPEREFRHLHCLGYGASLAAAEAYTAVTGQPVNMTAVDCWAKFQVITATVGEIATGIWKGVTEKRPVLAAMFPDVDWSELDQFAERLED